MEKILLILISLSILIGCKKDKSYTYTGILYKDCSKEPAANQELYLWQTVNNPVGISSGGEIANFTTNENGEFAVTFKDDNGFNIEMITTNPNPLFAGTTVLQRIPPRDLDLGNLYINNRAIIDFYIDVNTPYSSSDTLIIIGADVEIIGPFSNGLVQTIENYRWIPYYNSNLTQGEKQGIAWGINPNSTGSFSYYYYEPTGCEERDEITITIE